MRNRLLLLALAAGLSPPTLASAQVMDTTMSACATGQAANWTCIESNFNPTSVTNDEYVWFNMHLTNVEGLPSSGGTVYFKDQYITLVDNGQGDAQFAVPDGSITYVSGYGSPTITYDASGWHVTVSTSLMGSNVFMDGLGIQVPVGANWGGATSVFWEGTFWYDPALTGPITMDWQWAAAAYECDKTGATPAQIAACDAALGGSFNSLGVNVGSAPTALNDPINFVVGGARGGGASNVTGSWSPTVAGINADPLPAQPTVPEPATMVLLGTGLVGLLAKARKRFLA